MWFVGEVNCKYPIFFFLHLCNEYYQLILSPANGAFVLEGAEFFFYLYLLK